MLLPRILMALLIASTPLACHCPPPVEPVPACDPGTPPVFPVLHSVQSPGHVTLTDAEADLITLYKHDVDRYMARDRICHPPVNP